MVDLPSRMADLAPQPAGAPATEAVPVHLSVQLPSRLVAGYGRAKIGSERAARAEFAPLAADADADSAMRDARAALKEAGKKPLGAFVLEGVDRAFAAALQRHLDVRLPGSTVDLGGDGWPVDGAGTFVAIGAAATFTVNLRVEGPDGVVLPAGGTAPGKPVATDNLAWYLPISVVTFPVGFAICTVAIGELARDNQTWAFPAALDRAASSVVDAVVRQQQGAAPLSASADGADWSALDAELRTFLDGEDAVRQRFGAPHTETSAPGVCGQRIWSYTRSAGDRDEAEVVLFGKNGKICSHAFVSTTTGAGGDR